MRMGAPLSEIADDGIGGGLGGGGVARLHRADETIQVGGKRRLSAARARSRRACGTAALAAERILNGCGRALGAGEVPGFSVFDQIRENSAAKSSIGWTGKAAAEAGRPAE